MPKRLSHEYEVTLFYFNPNIHPAEEYERRLASVRNMSEVLGLELVEGEYDPSQWFEYVRGHADEREGGGRCGLCFRFRLGETARYASEYGFEAFASTLTVGRRKSAAKVNPVGLEVAKEHGVEFIDRDWKKAGGEDLSQLMAKEHDVYRQEYCGCVYSRLNS